MITNFIWAFSFPLIGYYLVGHVDNYFAILSRFTLAFLLFLPFINWRVNNKLKLQLTFIGAIQIGVMYIFYYQSFFYLKVSEVALFTVFTPFYVSLVYDICTKKFRALYLLSIGLAMIGAYVIKYQDISVDVIKGFLCVQLANLCFGTGQSLYKYVMENNKSINQKNIFGYFYLGAILVGIFSFFSFGNTALLPSTFKIWGILIYLGIVASGIGYFMWNKGASMVDSGILAIMNNVLIPLSIIVNFLFWGVDISNIKGFLIGSFLIVISLFIHNRLIKN